MDFNNIATRPLLLWGLFIIQLICTVFFALDAIRDLLGHTESSEAIADTVEGLVTVALVLGTMFTGWELRKTLSRQERLKRQLGVASGAFAQILETQFEKWQFTEAEKSVALLGIKGYSIAEIADIRGAKEGTVKAQNASVYRKAGVTGRLQLLSFFIDDLMNDQLI